MGISTQIPTVHIHDSIFQLFWIVLPEVSSSFGHMTYMVLVHGMTLQKK